MVRGGSAGFSTQGAALAWPAGANANAAAQGRADEFLRQLRAEAEASCDLGRWFTLIAIRPAAADDLRPLRGHLERLIREWDPFLAQGRVVLVLLADTGQTAALDFIDRLLVSVPSRHAPRFEHRCFAPGLAEADQAERWARSRLGA